MPASTGAQERLVQASEHRMSTAMWIVISWLIGAEEGSSMSVSIRKQILDQVNKLPLAQQQLVLTFASSLMRKTPRGLPGKSLLTFAGCIEAADAEAMTKAIEENFERVDVNGW
jgi:hypothetical protein